MKWNHIFKNDSNIYGDDSGQGALLASKCKRNFSPEMWHDDILKRKKAFLDSKNNLLKKSKNNL